MGFWKKQIRTRILEIVSTFIALFVVATSVVVGAWWSILSGVTIILWIVIADLRQRDVRDLKRAIAIQSEVIEGQRYTMDRMVGPIAKLTMPGDGPS